MIKCHSSIEGAQHGGKGLEGFLKFAAGAGAAGVQPSNFMLQKPGGSLMSAAEIKQVFDKVATDLNLTAPFKLDGVSIHCPTWVLLTAWTGSKTIRPFIPAEVRRLCPDEIEQWAEDQILALFDLFAELKVRIVPMFWGVAYGWELATGYPWGLWSGGEGDYAYDLIAEGKERFVAKTAKIRARANELGIFLAHEIHPGTAAQCAEEFAILVRICSGDPCLTVNGDPSHCWDGESMRTRFLHPAVAPRVVGCHVKNHTILAGQPLRCMEPDWQKRPMQFTDLRSGDIKLVRYVELMHRIGYVERYCTLTGSETAPLVTEAESAFMSLDACAADAIRYTNRRLCFEVATGSFEDGMGEQS